MSFLASSKLLSKCERMRDAGKAGKHVMTPLCDANGMYESTQCSEKMCWCAQPNGKLIPNTFHKKMVDRAPNCRRHAGKWSVFCVQILCILWCWLVFLSPFFAEVSGVWGVLHKNMCMMPLFVFLSPHLQETNQYVRGISLCFVREFVHYAPVCVFEPPIRKKQTSKLGASVF